MKKVLYIARAGLPVDATGLRIEQIGNLFENSGYRIHYICERHIDGSEKKNGFFPIPCTSLTKELDSNEVHFQLGDKVYSYLPKMSGGKINALKGIIELFTARKAFRRIRRMAETEKPNYIVLYNGTYPLEKKLIFYCRKRKIVLLGDVTEWYEKDKRKNFIERFIVSTTDKRIRKADKNLDGIIAISPYFYNYYNAKGVKTILIPPLIKTIDNNKLEKKEKLIRFIYAGSPGSKDIILPFIKAIVKVNEYEIRCRMDLVGIDLDYVHKSGCVEASEARGIYAYGRVPHQEAVKIVKEADFGVLIRYNQRYAKAGFSTKFAECMSMGVGMICNKIGGTDTFVTEGKDGFLLNSFDQEEIQALIQHILNLSQEDILKIKMNALKKANINFVLTEYQKQFDSFLNK